MMDRFNSEIDRADKELSNLRDTIHQLNKDLKALEEALRIEVRKNDNLSLRIAWLSATQFNPPFPYWLLEPITGKITHFNESYERYWLHPAGYTRDDRIALADRDLFGDEAAGRMLSCTIDAKEGGALAMTVVDAWVTTYGSNPKKWIIGQFPVSHTGTIVAIAGIALPYHPTDFEE